MSPLDRIAALSVRQKVIAGVAAVVVVAGGATGTALAVTGSSTKHTAAPPPTPATTAATPTPPPTTPKPKPKPRPAPAVNPLTGVGRPLTGPVIAVKIDDVAEAMPQVGIDQADIVYVEQVEGGLTRLIALFDTHLPSVVGPVRSTRIDNPEVLAQYGPIGFAASGGAPGPLAVLARSNLKTDLQQNGGPGFFRDDSRPIPHNLMLNLRQAAASIHGAAAKSIGWTWSSSLAGITGVQPGSSLSTTVGGTAVGFQWDAAHKRYIRVIGGALQYAADGYPVATPNVIVQFCRGHVDPADIDPAGNPGYVNESVGSGKVAIFRDGKRIDGTWSRPTAASGTVLRDKAGHVIPLAPGGAWIAMVNTTAGLTSH